MEKVLKVSVVKRFDDFLSKNVPEIISRIAPISNSTLIFKPKMGRLINISKWWKEAARININVQSNIMPHQVNLLCRQELAKNTRILSNAINMPMPIAIINAICARLLY